MSLSLVKTQLLTRTRLSRVGNFFGLCTLPSHGRSCRSWPSSLSPPTKKLTSHRGNKQLLHPHMALHTSARTRTYRASSSFLPRAKPKQQQQLLPNTKPPRVQDFPMAGGRSPPTLSLTDAGSPGSDADAPWKRQRMRSTPGLYAELAALLPGIPTRANQVEILDAAVAHLKVLEDTAGVLEAYKALQCEAPRRADVEVASREAVCFAARLPPAAARPGALTRVLEAFDRRGVEVLAVTMTRRGDGASQVIVIAAHAAPEVTESIKAEIAGIE